MSSSDYDKSVFCSFVDELIRSAEVRVYILAVRGAD